MAAAKSKKKKAPQKALPKTALTWEELLVEKALAMITENDRQISESAERFERQMKEKGRQINESVERFEQQIKVSAEQAGIEIETKESAEQTDRETKGSAGQSGREKKGSVKQSSRKMKISAGQPGWEIRETDRRSRFIEDQGGHINLPNLMQKFRKLGFAFEKAYKEAAIDDRKNNISLEIDITLESGDKVMIVGTKTRPAAKDITEHMEKMRKMRRYGDLHGEKRKYLGAICGIDFNNDEKLFALKNGFYVIEQSGETFVITAPEGVYYPKEW